VQASIVRPVRQSTGVLAGRRGGVAQRTQGKRTARKNLGQRRTDQEIRIERAQGLLEFPQLQVTLAGQAIGAREVRSQRKRGFAGFNRGLISPFLKVDQTAIDMNHVRGVPLPVKLDGRFEVHQRALAVAQEQVQVGALTVQERQRRRRRLQGDALVKLRLGVV